MDERCASELVAKSAYLVVEDEPVLRRLVRGHLTRRGFDVTAASTIAEAARALDERTFTHLVTDAILPDGTGFELLARVRNQAQKMVIVLMSGDESMGQTVRDMGEPRTRFLLKPFAMAALDAALAGTHLDP